MKLHWLVLLLAAACGASGADIAVAGGAAVLRSGKLEREIRFDGGTIRTTRFRVDGRQMLAAPSSEFALAITRERDNRRPRGLRPEEAPEKQYFGGGPGPRWRSDEFDPARYDDTRPDAPRWVDPQELAGAVEGAPAAQVTRPSPQVTRLVLTARPAGGGMLEEVSIALYYEVYEGHPAVRKWMAVRNAGSRWLKLERLMVENLHLAPLSRKSLAAALFGVQPSVVLESPGARAGVIAASEIPSALRTITDQGGMGYAPSLFEWVLGPGEEFVSEPVFYYGYSGEVRDTVSSVSTPLDRALEGPYAEFVHRHVGIAAENAPMHGPQWMTWAYFGPRIDDALVRQLASLAARCGFTEFLIDDGWQKGRLGTVVDESKFPDFAATAEYIRSQGLVLGLWVSSFRDLDSPDLAAMPNARSLPLLLRSPSLPGLAMSYASAWRDYNVRDLVALARRFGVRYFKQDFTNIMYGDLAEGHESRTRKESLLRGLRGLLAAQAALRREAPEVLNELTHEIYWGTPGVPADLAALKHSARFHIPPNQAIGAYVEREAQQRDVSPEEHAGQLRQGCWLARQRFYSHRGLPIYPLEFYAAATTNYRGSLSPDIQDRQVASWLMGAPVCFSGDLRTLTEENIAHYRKRLEAVRRLEKEYGIYKRFQFSGVPEPTDVDWHWWGKLNDEGHGAVVVVRGSGGAEARLINVPWVRREAVYAIRGAFSGKRYGSVAGRVLQDTGIRVELPVYGQELLELAPAGGAR